MPGENPRCTIVDYFGTKLYWHGENKYSIAEETRHTTATISEWQRLRGPLFIYLKPQQTIAA